MNSEVDAGGVCSSCGCVQPKNQSTACALPLQSILHGRYLIGCVLGQGGFGITYVAYDLAENRRVVIKELFPSFLVRRIPGETEVNSIKNLDSFKKCRDRFVEEAQLIYTFRDTPEIVDVYHIFLENHTAYYTMEFLEGQTLQKFRKMNGGRLTWGQLVPIVKDIIRALTVVHQGGSIHRDISPDNIFLSTGGVAKLIDFGSARYFKTGQKMTQIVKKGFAPWEQYQADGIFGPWTDIYALAATIYICLTGKLVPEAPARVTRDSLIRPTEFGVNIPPHIEQAIIQALNIYPDQRFRTIEAFAGALQIGDVRVRSAKGQWQLRCLRGQYNGLKVPFTSNIVSGRDPTRCTLVFPPDSPGISGVHLTLMQGSGPSFPGIRCESKSQPSYINGELFFGYGRIRKLQEGDRIALGNNQIFIVERLS